MLRRWTRTLFLLVMIALLVSPSLGVNADHEAGATAAVAGAVAVQTPLPRQRTALSDSLWVNMVLSMAYARDTQSQALARRLRRVDTAALLSIAGVSGLGLAQNISTLTTRDHDHHAHHEEDAHLHAEPESNTPAVLGVVGSGLTLATLGGRYLLSRHYQRRMTQRQQAIKGEIERIIDTLEASGNLPQAQSALEPYIGPRASREFVQLWQTSHP